jgi:hypothetical protein
MASVAIIGCEVPGLESDSAATPGRTPAPRRPRPKGGPATRRGREHANDGAWDQAPYRRTRRRPYKSSSQTGTIGITVTAIERGDQAAFRQRFGSRAAGMVPYYIRYTIENIGGTDLSTASAPLLSGVAPDGGSTGTIGIGTMPGCERGTPGDDFAAASANYQACRRQAARTGGTVAGAEYDEDEGGYGDNPIVWMG